MSKRASFSIVKVNKIFNRFNGRCAYCGSELTIKDMTVDHIIPKRNGGNNKYKNLFPACKSCNHEKGHLFINAYRRHKKTLVLHQLIIAEAYGLVEKMPSEHNRLKFYFERKPGAS